uniref:Uncharacterized protein n=1 Tax=Romanomermis culicivorax TaxID=13658 RepID=A0A915KE96_ROMCU
MMGLSNFQTIQRRRYTILNKILYIDSCLICYDRDSDCEETFDLKTSTKMTKSIIELMKFVKSTGIFPKTVCKSAITVPLCAKGMGIFCLYNTMLGSFKIELAHKFYPMSQGIPRCFCLLENFPGGTRAIPPLGNTRIGVTFLIRA